MEVVVLEERAVVEVVKNAYPAVAVAVADTEEGVADHLSRVAEVVAAVAAAAEVIIP